MKKKTRHVYLCGKNINKLLASSLLLATVGLKFSSSNLSLTFTSMPSSIRPSTILFFLEIKWITSPLLFYMRENNLRVKQKCVFYLTKLFLNLILYYFESMGKIIVVINQSKKNKLHCIPPSVHVWIKMTLMYCPFLFLI